MTVNDTVRIKKTDMVGTVTEIKGHHILVKFDTLSLPAMVFYDDEIELMSCDDTLIGCIRQSYGGAS